MSGYRGSPLGGLDQQFMRAKAALERHNVLFQSGLNEDLAATAIWGTQQAELRGEGKYDGVFGMWYGKGPGVDRTGDVFRHANFAGSSKNGGVLALMGDDHTAESSTTAHQSEFHFVDVMIPILNPAGVQEFIDYALYGWAMSRFCGSWVALKCMHETVESTGVVEAGLDSLKIVIPGDDEFKMPPGGLNIRLVDGILDMEARLHDYKRDAMLAFVHANKLNRIITSGGPNARIGIITVGKSYLDVRQAFDQLGIDEVKCNDLGIRLFKIGCPWPISRAELRDFAKGLELIIVVEEKRSLIEVQVREELYGTANQPVVIGKRDEKEDWLFPVKGALDPHDIAIAVGERVLRRGHVEEIANKVSRLKQAQSAVARHDRRVGAHALFLLGLPAQLIHRGAAGHARLRGHRLPLHVAVDGPQHARLDPHGRRGRELDRRGAVLQAQPRVPESRRRHLQSLRLSGDPRRGCVGRQRHLQDPVQRCGRDPDASLYYLAAMLEGGEDARFIARRMVVLASEDVGNADPQALSVAVAAAHAVEHVGLPECTFALAQAAIYLSLAPKSNAAGKALGAARAHIRDHGAALPPAALRSAAYPAARALGRGRGYDYPHDHPGHVNDQEHLPKGVEDGPVL